MLSLYNDNTELDFMSSSKWYQSILSRLFCFALKKPFTQNIKYFINDTLLQSCIFMRSDYWKKTSHWPNVDCFYMNVRNWLQSYGSDEIFSKTVTFVKCFLRQMIPRCIMYMHTQALLRFPLHVTVHKQRPSKDCQCSLVRFPVNHHLDSVVCLAKVWCWGYGFGDGRAPVGVFVSSLDCPIVFQNY